MRIHITPITTSSSKKVMKTTSRSTSALDSFARSFGAGGGSSYFLILSITVLLAANYVVPVVSIPLSVDYVGNPCNDFFSSGLCAECTGDCDGDSDCSGDLRCVKRRSDTDGEEDVPGCAWSGTDRFFDTDFCKCVV